MKKMLKMMLGMAVLTFSLTGCGISALEPEPVPLSGAHLGKMALDITAVDNTMTICGKSVEDFKQTMRNGFNYIAGEDIAVTTPEQATSTLRIDSLEATCLDDKFVKGDIITFRYKFTWKFSDGSEFSQAAVVPGASESSVKDALNNAVENLYNFAFSAYLSKLNLGAQG